MKIGWRPNHTKNTQTTVGKANKSLQKQQKHVRIECANGIIFVFRIWPPMSRYIFFFAVAPAVRPTQSLFIELI